MPKLVLGDTDKKRLMVKLYAVGLFKLCSTLLHHRPPTSIATRTSQQHHSGILESTTPAHSNSCRRTTSNLRWRTASHSRHLASNVNYKGKWRITTSSYMPPMCHPCATSVTLRHLSPHPQRRALIARIRPHVPLLCPMQ